MSTLYLLITLGLTAFGACMGVLYPFVGLLVYICFAIIKPDALWEDYGVPEQSYSRYVAMGFLTGWLMQQFSRFREQQPEEPVSIVVVRFGLQPLVYFSSLITGRRLATSGGERYMMGALACFFVLMLASAVVAFHQEKAWEYVDSMWKIVIPCFVGIAELNSIRRLKQLTWVILLSQSLIALEAHKHLYLHGYNKLMLDGMCAMDNNSMAIGLVTAAGLAFFFAMEGSTKTMMVLGFLLLGALGHSVMFSNSRGGMLGLLLVMGISAVLLPKKPIHYALLLLCVVVGIRLAGAGVVERFMTAFASKEDRDGSAQSRIELWNGCMQEMLENPVLGIGPNYFPEVVTKYGFERGKEAHTLWLQLGAELGMPATACLFAFFVLPILQLMPFAWRNDWAPDPFLNTASRMVIAAMIGFVFTVQFVSLKSLEIPYYVALIGAGVLKLNSPGILEPIQAEADATDGAVAWQSVSEPLSHHVHTVSEGAL